MLDSNARRYTYGLFCAAGVAEEGTCEPTRDEGERCDDFGLLACRSDLLCIWGLGDVSEYDAECRGRPGLGERCSGSYCGDKAVCDEATSTCVDPPGLGESCAGQLGSRRCEEGLVCTASDETCRRTLDLGDACGGPDVDCGLLRGIDGECVGRAELGDACDAHADCRTYHCDEGACAPYGCDPFGD